jgi:hypothetical protein
MAARPLSTGHEVVRKPLFETDLEVKCLAIMCKNVNSSTEITYHMNKRFKHGIKEYVLVSKVHAFKAERCGRFQSSWREFYVRPRGDCQSLEFLGEALNFDFIAEGGCLWDPGEVDCIVRSFHEGLVIKWIKHRLEESFGRRRKTTLRFIISIFSAWSHSNNPYHDIWSKYSLPPSSDLSGDKQSIDAPLHKRCLLPDGTGENLGGLNHSFNERADWQRPESLKNVEQRDPNNGRSLLDSMPHNAVSAILERSGPTEANSPQDAERSQMETPEYGVRPPAPTSLPSHEGLDLWNQFLPFVLSHLKSDVKPQATTTTGVSQSVLNSIASVQESEKPRSTVVSPNSERPPKSARLPDYTLEDNLRHLSPIPKFTQADFERFDKFLMEVDLWDQHLPSLPSNWIPNTAPQATTETAQSTLSSPTSQHHKSERPKDIVGPLITEHLADDAPEESLRSRSPILTLTQADFDKLDELVEELNVWGYRLPFWPSDLSPDDAPQATAEVSHSMESEKPNSSNGSPNTDHLSNERPQDDLQPLSLMPTISQADFDQFDQFIEDWYGSRVKFQLPHWSDGEATLKITNLEA